MSREPVNFPTPSQLTRISVSGRGDRYIVKTGDGEFRVRATRDGLYCECGKPRCRHVATLEMCGFVEPRSDERQAA